MFSAVAAVEWLVWKDRREAVDLSEQFTNHIGKTFWLHPDWSRTERAGEKSAENQVGGTQGGAYLQMIADGMSLPPEAAMPWDRNLTFTPALGDPAWQGQYKTDTFNLSLGNLPTASVNSEFYYGVRGFHIVSDPKDPNQIMQVLDRGVPVVWDFDFAGDTNGAIWQPSDTPDDGSHSMLIVGYDNRPGSDRERVFYVKNSYGATDQLHGLTLISFDYLKKYGYKAVWAESGFKERKTEYGFIGRWTLNTIAGANTLDVHHMPGVMARSFAEHDKAAQLDFRLGSLYFSSGEPTNLTPTSRVNGTLRNSTMKFYYSLRNKNMPYWQVDDPSMNKGILVHFSRGQYSAGFMRTGSTMVAVLGSKVGPLTSPPGALNLAEELIGTYRLYYGSGSGSLEVFRLTQTGELQARATIGRINYSGTVTRKSPSTYFDRRFFDFVGDAWFIDLKADAKPPIGTVYEQKIQLFGGQAMQGRQVMAGFSIVQTGFMAIKNLPRP